MKVEPYPRDALGGEAEKLDQVSHGLLEISNSDPAKASSLDLTIFDFYLHFLRVLEDSELMDRINSNLDYSSAGE